MEKGKIYQQREKLEQKHGGVAFPKEPPTEAATIS